jgi:N-succinyldiaminopimelate aminotransferase
MTERRQPHLTSRLQGFGTTVFAEMTRLAVEHDAVNLGQGFPNFDGPEFVKEAAMEAIRSGHNQYCRTAGVPELTRAVVHHQERFYGLEYDPESEVTVYAGATEGIFATLQALCEVGDEVVFFEPFYDSYLASVAMAGAVGKAVTLRPPDFGYDPEELEAAITPKTRAILLNSPHNPSGKVFSRAELEHVAELCKRHDILAITDEVYEHLVFEGEHLPLATLPGMWERTVILSSTAKTFSFTGWKIGYSCAPAAISAALRTAHQFITFCNGTPFQHAMAKALGAPDSYYDQLLEEYRERRDRFCDGLAGVGFGVYRPAGTYFALADLRPLGYDNDVAFCRMLPGRVGVAAVPPTAFYVHKEEGRFMVRFAFCKTLELLDEAIRRLGKLGEPA